MSNADESTTADEYCADNAAIRQLISATRSAMRTSDSHARLVEELRPAFASLLQHDGWLPPAFAQPYAASGMGGGIGQYLLYRGADRALTLFSLVVPPGSATPIHDHLAWGLVGLYRGEQREEVYHLTNAHYEHGHAELRVAQVQTLRQGEFYALLPPDGDIHRVQTISSEPSISIHLLGNDAGCVLRHRFELETNRVTAFQSGYSNRPCVSPDRQTVASEQ